MKTPKDKLVKKHRDELKNFYLWIDENYALGMLTDKIDIVLDEYM